VKTTTDQRIAEIARLIYSSCDDLKSSLAFVTESALLEEAAAMCESLGYKTKLTMIRRRIAQLRKGRTK
jgi:hypothetical protein